MCCSLHSIVVTRKAKVGPWMSGGMDTGFALTMSRGNGMRSSTYLGRWSPFMRLAHALSRTPPTATTKETLPMTIPTTIHEFLHLIPHADLFSRIPRQRRRCAIASYGSCKCAHVHCFPCTCYGATSRSPRFTLRDTHLTFNVAYPLSCPCPLLAVGARHRQRRLHAGDPLRSLLVSLLGVTRPLGASRSESRAMPTRCSRRA